MLKRIEFRGEKHGTVTEGPFEFEWPELEAGLYTILSEGNLKGKSSILHVVRWLLRGDPASGFQQDVKSWIQKASLRFTLNNDEFEVFLDDPAIGVGVVKRLINEKWTDIASFGSHPEFKSTMSDFFLRELGLDALPSWRDDIGIEVIHDWAALSGALSIGPTFDSLLGEVSMAGLPTRLMQMYLGLPWVSTYCAAKVAESQLKREAKERSRRWEEAQNDLKTRKIELEAQLNHARQQLAHLPALDDYHTRYKIASDALLNAQALNRNAVNALEATKSAQELLDTTELDDQRRVVEITEVLEAGRVFRALDPKCCPKCDSLVTEERRQRELQANLCAMCGEILKAGDDSELELELAKDTAAKSKAAAEEHRIIIRTSEIDCERAAEEVQRRKTRMSNLEAELLSGEQRSDLMFEIARIEARLEEIQRPQLPEDSERKLEMAIVSAAVEETNARVKEVQDGLLIEVSRQIVNYARRFGMIQLSEATLRGNASLTIVKGGKSTNFSSLTVGEKLRVKIATVLAILKSGEKRGIGRHPGLLFIDSPGAQELADDNLEDLMRELKAVATELEHLQVFVAAVASEPILKHVDTNRLLRSEGDQWMW